MCQIDIQVPITKFIKEKVYVQIYSKALIKAWHIYNCIYHSTYQLFSMLQELY